jgi:hypothetical protein
MTTYNAKGEQDKVTEEAGSRNKEYIKPAATVTKTTITTTTQPT